VTQYKCHSKTDTITKAQIKQYAKLTRTYSLVTKRETFPVTHFIENTMSELDDTYSFEVVNDSEMPKGVYAFTDIEENKITVAESVYNDAVAEDGRARFTLAHEIGHYFMIKKFNIKLYTMSKAVDLPLAWNPERQANIFANELLIPDDMIDNLNTFEISDRYQTSYMVAEIAQKHRNRKGGK
jgi:Zn-dependent peptidase ImmA (M78 family)